MATILFIVWRTSPRARELDSTDDAPPAIAAAMGITLVFALSAFYLLMILKTFRMLKRE